MHAPIDLSNNPINKNLLVEDSLSSIFDFGYFFNLTPDLICIAGFDGYFKKVNPAVCKTLDSTEEELLKKPFNILVHPDDRITTTATLKQIAQGITIRDFENRYLSKTGKIVWLSWSAIADSKQELVFAIAKDITSRKKLDESRRISAAVNRSSVQKDEQLPIQVLKTAALLSEHYYMSTFDQLWLYNFEHLVRKYIGKVQLTLDLLSQEMAIGERQLFRNCIGLSKSYKRCGNC